MHDDGEMFSSALWEIREAIGSEVADQLFFDALVMFDNTTNFTTAGEMIIAQAALLDPPLDETVRGVFVNHGLLNCERAKPFQDGDLERPLTVDSASSSGIFCFRNMTPTYFQFNFVVEEGTQVVTIDYAASAGGFMGISIPGMGGEVELGIAFKHGSAIQWECTPGQGASHDGIVLIEGTATNDGFTVELSGDCVEPGVYYLQFVNLGASMASVSSMSLTQSPDDPSDPTCP